MRTATHKNASTNKSKSVKLTLKKPVSKRIIKTAPKQTIEKPKSQATTHLSTSIPLIPKKPNKQSQLIALLKDPKGADIQMLMQATDWQAHSIRGLISGTLRKKLGLNVVITKLGGSLRYRIEQPIVD
ncbi:DUF3489 domain-containing protein [Polynucleobacter sp.]|jgi:hypothetical protein|uniref:DUF3489 domain-containing protein n=1 Tax=Polynucleobacter sp. TaxID=2029855 RepID=UPI00258CD5C4|nr:DUF3489 domain-containing protein [Polynucleobacter sp.]MCX7237148.1 DUF3489 domain-containing protein [Polynucleobacter sp.]